jgi:5'-nucleotidase
MVLRGMLRVFALITIVSSFSDLTRSGGGRFRRNPIVHIARLGRDRVEQIAEDSKTSSNDDRTVYCNRHINWSNIEAVGFDMDWTLAGYSSNLNRLIYDGAKTKLVCGFGYPQEVMNFEYNDAACQRGCTIDVSRGNLLKMNRRNQVKIGVHGKFAMRRSCIDLLYSQNNSHDFSGPDFIPIDTPYNKADVSLFLSLVQYYDDLKNHNVTFRKLWEDTRHCIQACHTDGTLNIPVITNPGLYLVRDPLLFPMLEALRKRGRKLFLVTNSLWNYTHAIMNYLEGKKTAEVDRDLKWTDYFDVIIVGSKKPAFFSQSESAETLLSGDDRDNDPFRNKSGGMPGMSHALYVPRGDLFRAQTQPARDDHKLFLGGSAEFVHNRLNVSSGERVLYVGDHLYADVVKSKRTCKWRTCLIVPELRKEVFNAKEQRRKHKVISTMKQKLLFLEKVCLQEAESSNNQSEVHFSIQALQKSLSKVISKYESTFHPIWGSLFEVHFDQSRFGKQAFDYACMFTSRPSNLLTVMNELEMNNK